MEYGQNNQKQAAQYIAKRTQMRAGAGECGRQAQRHAQGREQNRVRHEQAMRERDKQARAGQKPR